MPGCSFSLYARPFHQIVISLIKSIFCFINHILPGKVINNQEHLKLP
jgi:hypothetical protein